MAGAERGLSSAEAAERLRRFSAALSQAVSSIIVALMLLLSVALSFAQAYRSQQAAGRLRALVGQTATSCGMASSARCPPSRCRAT